MIWAFLIVLAFGLFTVVVAFLLPKATLRAHFSSVGTTDIGIKKVREPNGRAIVYIPAGATSRYIEQYLLSERRGKKVMLCKLNSRVCYLDYNVVIFDEHNNVLEIKHVEELIENRGYTQELPLPEAASYVQIELLTVNNKKVGVAKKNGIPLKNALLFAVFAALISLVEIMFVRFCVIKLLAGIFYESFVTSLSNTIIGFIVAGGVCLVNALATVLVLTVGGKKKQ